MNYTHNTDWSGPLSSFYEELLKTGPKVTDPYGWLNTPLSLIPLILLLALLAFTFYNTKVLKSIYSHIKLVAFLIFITGMGLYWRGFNMLGSENNAIVLAFRSLLAALEMFATKSSLREVDPYLHSRALYMTIFAIVHFLAVCVSAILIIKLFGYRFISWIRIIKWTILSYAKKISGQELFVFYGINQNSITLGMDIRKQLKNRARIIYIKTPDQTKPLTLLSRFNFSSIFHDSHTSSGTMLEYIEEMEAVLVKADKPIDTSLVKHITHRNDFYTEIGLAHLGRLIKYFSAYNKTELYFLSDQEKENIEAVMGFKKLYTLSLNDNLDKGKRNIHFYCHACNSFFNKKLLKTDKHGFNIDIIDSSFLSVVQLKKDVRHHPISYVTHDEKAGVVNSPFHALIIGFGETGKEALKFLYEFSSFVDPHLDESEKRFYIADVNLEKEKTLFLQSAPALKQKENLEWWNMSTHTEAFYGKLQEVIDQVNYIVITMNNDDEATTLATSLYDFVHRYRKDLNHFRIYVRLKSSKQKEMMKEFNRLLNGPAPQEASATAIAERPGHPLSDDAYTPLIYVFGTTRSIFNYDVVSTDHIGQNAKDFYHTYFPKANSFEREDVKKSALNRKMQGMNADELWDFRERFKLDRKNPELALARTSFSDYIEYTYQEAQDISNVWHIQTKAALAGLYQFKPDQSRLDDIRRELSREDRERKRQWAEGEPIHSEEPVNKTGISLLLDNLDMTEHLRWIAKMELMGFVLGSRKDYLRRQHPCLVDCHTLRNKELNYTIDYDRCTVILSFEKFRFSESEPQEKSI